MKNRIGWCKQALMLAGCGVLALCLSGCIIAVTERQVSWNGLSAGRGWSACWEEGPNSFWVISYTPEPGTPVITIRMPDGKFIPANNLTRDTLAPYFAAGTASEDKGLVGIKYDRGGYVAVRLDEHGNPEKVEVWGGSAHSTTPGNRPAISTPDGNTILEFPLRDKELEDLLGEPTKDERKTEYGPLTV